MSGEGQLDDLDALAEAMKDRPGRNAARIPRVLAALCELWMENPDLRLGQIISNACIAFYTEDDQAERELRKWTEYLRERKNPRG